MSRSQLTRWLAGGLATALLALGGFATVPYVQLSPGPATNTLGEVKGAPVLAISGARTFPTDGRLDLTTVQLRDDLTLFQALAGWVSSRDAVIPREFVYPEDQSEDENEKQTQKEMVDSQGDAANAALLELGLTTLVVESVNKGGASQGKLRAGDVLVAVDGTSINGPVALRAAIRKHRVGEQVEIGYLRAGERRSATIVTGPAPDEPAKPAIGVLTKITSRVKVEIKLEQVGGPSAGLMFALGIIDKLGPKSLTGGRHIAGTGTIGVDGTVGPIGGIAEKLIGAEDAGASFFLVPAGNCAEAVMHRPDSLTLVKVGTLKEALAGLAAVRGGRPARSC